MGKQRVYFQHAEVLGHTTSLSWPEISKQSSLFLADELTSSVLTMWIHEASLWHMFGFFNLNIMDNYFWTSRNYLWRNVLFPDAKPGQVQFNHNSSLPLSVSWIPWVRQYVKFQPHWVCCLAALSVVPENVLRVSLLLVKPFKANKMPGSWGVM